ncbi:Gastricsin precursor, putative [Perkinsus marinus ATCC 50983]|uniref:Gastricsin, putative n=1 Tax=Perkinsus marinus (strain ATCC 50983 / TXsc) TaxID=423536 RepID=C5KFM0_PERM5|nr:Gastricsin precursor, putative [Perkinsus marinus ATCC 50983]EER16769.1 Gastricsin precursor, putative [Perkinsus marinus ATCC 50983]|eukprot:XP_002784973.1 Gastricsin precursor, putative [Perkinsus marinus ATCC 50983]
MNLSARIIFIASVTGGILGDVLRLDVHRRLVKDARMSLLSLNVDLQADGQKMAAVVDTGSSAPLWVWKDWYEKELGVGACEKLVFKCYKCPQGCVPGETTTITFGNSIAVTVFQHIGAVQFGSTTVRDIKFGLITGYNPPPTVYVPHPIFGLGPVRDPNYPSIMAQLVGRELIKESTFSFYLKPETLFKKGFDEALLLGGGDPKLYKGQLRYVPIVVANHFEAMLEGLQVGTGKSTSLKENVIFDTGSNYLYVPDSRMVELLKDIEEQATLKAKTQVKLTYFEAANVWEVDCVYRKFMPTLRFLFQDSAGQEVALELDYRSYVAMRSGVCYLEIMGKPQSMWILPDIMLVANYLEFQPDQERVGMARLKL